MARLRVDRRPRTPAAPAPRRAPLRWPMVKACTPPWRPTARPSASTMGPGAQPIRRAVGHEGVVAARGDEAELLALALGGARQPARERLGAHLLLRRVAEREEEPRELVGAEHVEEVALVLRPVAAAVEARDAALGRHARVVARRDERGAEAVGQREELAQLHRAVARDARARRLAGEVGVDEGVDDVLGGRARAGRTCSGGCRGGRRRGARRAGPRARSSARGRCRRRGSPRGGA